MKRYLLTMVSLLGAALSAGIVVWYLYQNLEGARPNDLELQNTEESIEMRVSSADTPPEESFVISAASLSSEQQKILEDFGAGPHSITQMRLTCAKEALGEKRLFEIVQGAAPTPFEATKLRSCMEK